MFHFYRYRFITKPLTSIILSDEMCPACNKKGCIEVTLYLRYAKVFIPILSMGRPTSVCCIECGHEIKSVNTPLFDKNKYSPGVTNGIKDIQASRKRSLLEFINPWTVLILLGLSLTYGLISLWSFSSNKTVNNELLKSPKVGDIYKVNIDSMFISADEKAVENKISKTLFKIMDIKNDTLLMVRNKHKAEGIGLCESDWNSLSRKNNDFGSTPYKISSKGISEKKEILEFFNKKKMDSINKTDLVKSTNPFHFSKSIGKIPDYNGIEIIERK